MAPKEVASEKKSPNRKNNLNWVGNCPVLMIFVIQKVVFRARSHGIDQIPENPKNNVFDQKTDSKFVKQFGRVLAASPKTVKLT